MSTEPTNPMRQKAREILRANDTGNSFQASQSDHPHQWSWDSALIAIGLAHVNIDRAVQEMRSLFRGQWKSGMVPHIVFNPRADPNAYYPSADVWDVQTVTDDAPTEVRTSGILHPPVHAITIRTICDACPSEQARAIAREFYEPLRNWHRYLVSARDPENSGLVTIVHPSESGMATSPRWDHALSRVQIPEDDRAAYARPHRRPEDRPNDEDYTRYNRIIAILKSAGYRVEQAYDDLPFRCKDVFISSMLVAANESLLRIADMADVDVDELNTIESWINSGRRGLANQWSHELNTTADKDLVDGSDIHMLTLASFAPLLAGQVTPEIRQHLVRLWSSPAFVGHAGLRWKLPPSASPEAPGFDPQRYWRGPVWPVMNWLMWWAWQRIGEFAIADAIRWNALDQIETVGFYEYMDPFTGQGLGAANKSWTAAVALDWLAE